MTIKITLNKMLRKRNLDVIQLSQKAGLNKSDLSILMQGNAQAIRISTLDAICSALKCSPKDVIEYVDD